ncbi:MAG TPA: ABC transporter permease, partial [Candidatus Acidoferrales bacterium]|nr:ABC transporter permease [Candidatus Acidoferrales bacterium]
GIGVNTALFSIVNSVLLNPLPYPQPNQLVAIYEKTTQFGRGSISYPNFLDWQRDNRTFSEIAGYRNDDFNLTGQGTSERIKTCMASAQYFSVLGVQMELGRNFTLEEDKAGGTPVVVISSAFWSRKFASARDVLGKRLTLNGQDYTIIGVLPASFQFRRSNELYVPLGQWTDPTFLNRGVSMGMNGVGRLKPGATQAQAQADTDAISTHLAEMYPTTNKGRTVGLYPLKADMVGGISQFLYILLGAVGFVLLIACANVANLLLARSLARTREFAIRTALGASRARVIWQLLTESVLLGLVGGGAGLLLAAYATKSVLQALPAALPRSAEIGLDWHVMVFTFSVSVLAGVIFGLTPAVRMWRPDVHETLKEGGRGSSGARHRAQGVFVVAEMAIALVLLIGAGLMIRSLAALWGVNPGFDPHNVLNFSVALQPSLLSQPGTVRGTMQNLQERLLAMPGVQAVSSLGGGLPLSGDDSELPFWVDGRPKPAAQTDMPFALFYLVDSGYAATLKLPLRKGRFIATTDDAKSPSVVVIDEMFAKKFFPNEDPVGKYLHLELLNMQPRIIGVTGHVKHWSLDKDSESPIQEQMYLPMGQLPEQFLPLVVRGFGYIARTAGAPESYSTPIREMVTQMSSQQVAYGFESMDGIISDSLAARRFSMFLLGVFASVALILASIGIYGVVSYLVGQRMHELGIRVALGAQRGDVLRLVLGQGLKMALIGVAIGVAAALGLTRLMSQMLFGVSAADPLTYLGVAILLTIIALAACYVPARRAMRVDPIIALRYE